MTEKLLTAFKLDIAHLKLIPGRGGCFEVIVGREKIYSKLDTGQFPDEQQIINDIVRRMES